MSVSSTLIARSNEQWELHESWRESFFFFRFPCFCSFSSPLLFLRLLTLVKLLTVRVITPTVTCRWYVIIFSFYLLLMGNDLEQSLASATLYDSRATLMTGQTSQTSHWVSSKFEPAQSWWKCMRVDESWWSNESESCDFNPLTSSFDQALTKKVTVLSSQQCFLSIFLHNSLFCEDPMKAASDIN